MQIEIKGHGLAGLWHDMLADSSVTSALAVGVAALAISYAAWKIGHGVGHAKRKLAALPKPKARKPRSTVKATAVAPPAPARTLAEQWQRLDGTMAGAVGKADAATAAHGRASILVDALDLEVADLLSDIAGVSAYAAHRTRPVAGPVEAVPQRPAASLAA